MKAVWPPASACVGGGHPTGAAIDATTGAGHRATRPLTTRPTAGVDLLAAGAASASSAAASGDGQGASRENRSEKTKV